MEKEIIRGKIEKEDYQREAKEPSWGGAGIAICSEPNDGWERDETLNYYCTENARCFIWLLEEIREWVYYGPFDKYERCGAFIEAIKKAKKQHRDLKEQLLSVLEQMEPKDEKAGGEKK